MTNKIKVVFFQRKPFPIHKSLEFIFDDIRSRLPSDIISVKKVFSVYSKGIIPRIKIMFEAFLNQGDVNHVTGDIHFAAIWLKRRKTIMTVLDCGLLSGSSGIKHILLKYFWFTLPLKKCSLVTVISDSTKSELLKFSNYDAESIHVIPVAISPLFKYVSGNFNKDKPVILQVGTTTNKNLHRLIEALEGLRCQLTIIGVLPAEVIKKLKAHKVDYVNRCDLSQRELIEEYKRCDLLSFVSTYEGFGMPIVEANATGRAVITSKISSMPEVAGEAACLVNPYVVSEIRQGILKIINDDSYRNILIKKGLANVKRFDPKYIATKYATLYKKIALKECAE